MSATILATKLHRPALHPRRVPRPSLVARLNDGRARGRRLTLVSAPAGFGKTTCVTEWLSDLDLPLCWLSLEAADDEPGRFFAYLVAALQRAEPTLGQELSRILQGSQLPSTESLITTLLNDIVQTRRQFFLVLDDFHLVHDDAILAAMSRLVTNQPENMHLVLVTREDPPLPLARLRANDQMTEIRAADLRFNSDETGRFLNDLMELALSPDDIAALGRRTEGWVAGLQLAALSMRGRNDPSVFIADLSGSHHYILTYLTEEVLDRQPVDIRGFLLQTSILGRLNADLCQAVTGRADSGVLLERSCAANLFLIPLDDDHLWYRYHHLFANLLATRLRQTLPADEVSALHSRASDWLAQNGFHDEAMAHALAGKDYGRAVALVDHLAVELIYAGRLDTLRKWLADIPGDSFAANPRLKIYDAWIALLQGRSDLSAEGLRDKQSLLNALPPSPQNDRIRRELTLVLCRYLPIQGDIAGAIHLAREALEHLPEEDLASRARAAFSLFVAYSLGADAVNSQLAFQDCVRLAQAAGDFGLIAEATGLLAQDRFHRGQLHEAARLYQSVVDLDAASGQEPFYPAGVGYIGLANVYLEWNDLDRAESCLAHGMDLCARGGLDGIYSGYYVRSRLCQARGDLAGAQAAIDLLDRDFPRLDDPLKATRQIEILRARGDTAGISRVAVPWLRILNAKPRPPAAVQEVIQSVAARVFLAQRETDLAARLLEEVRATAEPGGRFRPLIESYLLGALALQQRHAGTRPLAPDEATPAALACIERGLALAEPEGYVLLFVERAPDVVPLLRAAAGDPAASATMRSYARRLLAALESERSPDTVVVSAAAGATCAEPPTPDRPPDPATGTATEDREGPVEPLTERELEILRLIEDGYTNQDIAGRLVVTLHTVKKHSSNIFGKLGVTNRTQAVARARRLGWL